MIDHIGADIRTPDPHAQPGKITASEGIDYRSYPFVSAIAPFLFDF